MHLTFINIIKTFFTPDFKQGSQAHHADHGDHAYVPGESENRGPCPGLNSLAHQYYL